MAGFLSVPALEVLINRFQDDRTNGFACLSMISGILNYYFTLANDFAVLFHPAEKDVPAYFVVQRLLRQLPGRDNRKLVDHLVVAVSPLASSPSPTKLSKGKFFAGPLPQDEPDVRFRPLEAVLQHCQMDRYSYWVMFFDRDRVTFHKYDECENLLDWLEPLSILGPSSDHGLPTGYPLREYARLIDWMLRYMRRDVELAIDGAVER
jgi:hypothetical protein